MQTERIELMNGERTNGSNKGREETRRNNVRSRSGLAQPGTGAQHRKQGKQPADNNTFKAPFPFQRKAEEHRTQFGVYCFPPFRTRAAEQKKGHDARENPEKGERGEKQKLGTRKHAARTEGRDVDLTYPTRIGNTPTHRPSSRIPRTQRTQARPPLCQIGCVHTLTRAHTRKHTGHLTPLPTKTAPSPPEIEPHAGNYISARVRETPHSSHDRVGVVRSPASLH